MRHQTLLHKLSYTFVFSLFTLTPHAVFADAAKRQCLSSAETEYQTCKNICQDTRTSAKVLCGVNPECNRACGVDYDTCAEPYKNKLSDCKSACDATYVTGRDACKVSTACGSQCEHNAAYLDCRRPFAVTDYACKKTCEDASKTDTASRDAIKACAVTRNACLKVCRSTPTPTPTPAPAQ